MTRLRARAWTKWAAWVAIDNGVGMQQKKSQEGEGHAFPAGIASVQVDVIEIYVPARLEYLASLYAWLDDELKGARSRALFLGFSLYEVNGAFRGRRKVYEERTIVVRLIFDVDACSRERDSREVRIRERSAERSWISREARRRRSGSFGLLPTSTKYKRGAD